MGHLWQGKYYAELIKNDRQMLEVSRYIHLNPVKAKMVERPEEYRWSSCAMYLGKKKEELISSNRILSYFKDEKKGQLYNEYLHRTPQVEGEKPE